jgi:predicted amidohydrolase
MYVNALQPNVDGMIHRLDLLMARFPWTQMVLFSELAPFGPLTKFSLPLRNETVDRFCEAARRHNVWLIPGSMFETAEDGRIYNTSTVINPQGEIVCNYRKMFPFRPYEAGVDAGTGFCVFDVPEVGRFGLSICYDVRFAYLYRKLAKAGATILTVPSAFTKPTGRAHWEVLLRARAIETGSFIIAPAQGGVHEDGRKTWGHSLVIGPWGEVIAEIEDDKPGLLYADIDPDDARQARARIPALSGDREITGP